MMRTIKIFLMLLTIIICQNSLAEVSWRDNTHLLPQYCKDRALKDDNWTKWRTTFGEAYIHMHHYCAGVFAEVNVKSSLNQDNNFDWIAEAKHQMKYVSPSCKAGECFLYPELHTRWAWALGKEGQIAEAVKHYQLAFQEKQDYIPAYIKLSRLYLKNHQPDEARKILELGLKANPNSRALKRRLKKIESSR